MFNSSKLSITETATIFGVHPATVRRWTRKPSLGFPPPEKLPDGRLEFDRHAIESYRDQRQTA